MLATDQLKKVFPEVLSHQPEKSQKCPTKRVIAGVTIIWISANLQANITLWTDPEHIIIINTISDMITCLYELIRGIHVNLPGISAVSTQQRISLSRQIVVVIYRQGGRQALNFYL